MTPVSSPQPQRAEDPQCRCGHRYSGHRWSDVLSESACETCDDCENFAYAQFTPAVSSSTPDEQAAKKRARRAEYAKAYRLGGLTRVMALADREAAQRKAQPTCLEVARGVGGRVLICAESPHDKSKAHRDLDGATWTQLSGRELPADANAALVVVREQLTQARALLANSASALHVALAYAEGLLPPDETREADIQGCFIVLALLREATNPPSPPTYTTEEPTP